MISFIIILYVLNFQGIASNSVIIQPQIVVFSESESNGLLRENYSFQYSINHSSILQHNELGLVVTEEAFNEHPVSNGRYIGSVLCPLNEGYFN